MGHKHAQDLDARRAAEIARYDTEDKYPGIMRLWRQDIIREWLQAKRGAGHVRYLDVGCGKGESLAIGESLHFVSRGCEVVDYLCVRPDVDKVPGAHDLGMYHDGAFDYVTCLDVLEHVLEEDVPAALSEMRRVASKAILLGISQKPGPWHPTIKPTEWWTDQVRAAMGSEPAIVYDDRIPDVKRPYVWLEVQCGS